MDLEKLVVIFLKYKFQLYKNPFFYLTLVALFVATNHAT